MKSRIFSGIQPSGGLHLGNYLGAIRQWVERQDEGENMFCIVDLHALTVPREPAVFNKNIRELATMFFACGIDPTKSTVFIQSHMHEHSELAWILECFISMGQMKRMTQFKEKSEKKKDQVSVGLFAYPVLMAADILLYETDEVPVGEDQKQHVELTRDVAESFNAKYGRVFKIPKPVIPKVGARIMGLDDPTKKMAKSDDNPGRCIYLLDEPDVIRKKIARATTDSLKEIRFDEKRPGIYNLLSIYALLSKKSHKEIEDHFAGKQYSDLKKELAELVIGFLSPLQKRFKELNEDGREVEKFLVEGAEKIHPIAQRTLSRVRSALGLI